MNLLATKFFGFVTSDVKSTVPRTDTFQQMLHETKITSVTKEVPSIVQNSKTRNAPNTQGAQSQEMHVARPLESVFVTKISFLGDGGVLLISYVWTHTTHQR